MKITLHPNFDKAYRKRIFQNKKLVKKVDERIKIFQSNPKSPILKTHSLTGEKQGYSSFSITGDIRIIYIQLNEDMVIFHDIGSHNQVY